VSRYRVVLHLAPRFSWWHERMDARSLRASLADAEINQVTEDQRREMTLVVTLERDDQQAVAQDLFAIAQKFGYILVNGEISKIVGSEIQGAILTGLGGGLCGAASNNGLVALLAAVGGGLAGWLAGSCLERVESVYEVRPNQLGHWVVSERRPQVRSPKEGIAWS
jgi:hypothetical protein